MTKELRMSSFHLSLYYYLLSSTSPQWLDRRLWSVYKNGKSILLVLFFKEFIWHVSMGTCPGIIFMLSLMPRALHNGSTWLIGDIIIHKTRNHLNKQKSSVCHLLVRPGKIHVFPHLSLYNLSVAKLQTASHMFCYKVKWWKWNVTWWQSHIHCAENFSVIVIRTSCSSWIISIHLITNIINVY